MRQSSMGGHCIWCLVYNCVMSDYHYFFKFILQAFTGFTGSSLPFFRLVYVDIKKHNNTVHPMIWVSCPRSSFPQGSCSLNSHFIVRKNDLVCEYISYVHVFYV